MPGFDCNLDFVQILYVPGIFLKLLKFSFLCHIFNIRSAGCIYFMTNYYKHMDGISSQSNR